MLLGAAVLGTIALAQDGEDGTVWPFDLRQRVHDAIAAALGISADEYDAVVDTARQQVLDDAVSEGVLTEEQAERMSERWAQGVGPGGMGAFGRGRGMMGRQGGFGGMMAGTEISLLGVAAEELGMTLDELTAALQDGKTIADLAAEKGVEPQVIADAFVAQRAEWLAEAVADGRITQQQADWMLENMQEQVLEHLDAPFAGAAGPGGCWGGHQGGSWRRGGGMMGPGGLQGFPGTDES
jgi:polyhydroxyalkanoate synthesis regulator phasin